MKFPIKISVQTTVLLSSFVLLLAVGIVLHTNHTTKSQTGVLGASIQAGGLAITINKMKTYSPDKVTGLQRLTLNITTKNIGTETLQISPGMQMSVLDENGTSHPASAQFLDTSTIIGGTLAAHANRTQDIDFTLPFESARTFMFEYNAASTAIKVGL